MLDMRHSSYSADIPANKMTPCVRARATWFRLNHQPDLCKDPSEWACSMLRRQHPHLHEAPRASYTLCSAYLLPVCSLLHTWMIAPHIRQRSIAILPLFSLLEIHCRKVLRIDQVREVYQGNQCEHVSLKHDVPLKSFRWRRTAEQCSRQS
jgi:hypothetical protein